MCAALSADSGVKGSVAKHSGMVKFLSMCCPLQVVAMGRNKEALDRLMRLDRTRVAAAWLTGSQTPAEALKAALGSQEVRRWLPQPGSHTCTSSTHAAPSHVVPTPPACTTVYWGSRQPVLTPGHPKRTALADPSASSVRRPTWRWTLWGKLTRRTSRWPACAA